MREWFDGVEIVRGGESKGGEVSWVSCGGYC